MQLFFGILLPSIGMYNRPTETLIFEVNGEESAENKASDHPRKSPTITKELIMFSKLNHENYTPLCTMSSIAAENWMHNKNHQQAPATVSANELTSLSALIAYVAHNSGENEFRIERRLADRFNIPNVSRLPAALFDTALRYLVDGMPRAVAA